MDKIDLFVIIFLVVAIIITIYYNKTKNIQQMEHFSLLDKTESIINKINNVNNSVNNNIEKITNEVSSGLENKTIAEITKENLTKIRDTAVELNNDTINKITQRTLEYVVSKTKEEEKLPIKTDVLQQNYSVNTKDKTGRVNVKFPDNDNIVKYYGETKQKIVNGEEKIKKDIKKGDVCKNEYIKKGYSYRIITDPTKIKNETNSAFKTGLNEIDDTMNDDPALFYSSKIKILKTFLEDPKMRGHNILKDDTYAGIKEIGNIDLNSKPTHPSEYGTVKKYNID